MIVMEDTIYHLLTYILTLWAQQYHLRRSINENESERNDLVLFVLRIHFDVVVSSPILYT
jgi:hypothetical protein